MVSIHGLFESVWHVPLATTSKISTGRPYMPQTDPRGCYSYYTQAMCRNLQRTDLVSEYHEEGSEVHKPFKMMASLLFVPEDVLPGDTSNLYSLPTCLPPWTTTCRSTPGLDRPTEILSSHTTDGITTTQQPFSFHDQAI